MEKRIHIDQCPVCNSNESYLFEYCPDMLSSSEVFTIFRCNDCGFIFTQDSPDEDLIDKYYKSQNYISHHNSKNLFGRIYNMVRSWMGKKKIRLIKRHKKGKNLNLLDIGCGQGHFLKDARKKKFEVTGIEKSESTRNRAKEEFGLTIEAPAFIREIKDKSMDVVTLWHSLEHIHDLHGTMKQIHRILKDDGIVVLALPNMNSLDAKHYGIYWAGYDAPRHLWHFNPKTLKALAEKHHFEVIKTKRMPFDAFYISILSEKNKKSASPSLKGMIFGLKSFFKSRKNIHLASSVIYILKKK